MSFALIVSPIVNMPPDKPESFDVAVDFESRLDGIGSVSRSVMGSLSSIGNESTELLKLRQLGAKYEISRLRCDALCWLSVSLSECLLAWLVRA